MSTPLNSYLIYKLSGMKITDNVLSRPVCNLCENRGKSDEEMLVSERDPVYACAWWKEWSGWELFGVYHNSHNVSDIVDGSPPRPTAILEGIIEKTNYKNNPELRADAYTLTDLSFVQISNPSSLNHM